MRPTWDEYFMDIMHAVAKRATCNRGRVGCVVVKNKRILVTGYVGAPKGLPHCDEVDHDLKEVKHRDGRITKHCQRTVHAEMNAICQAAANGISISGSTVYCSMTPCRVCTMMLINCGVERVICEKRYHDGADSERMFKDAGIDLIHMTGETVNYLDQ